MLIKIKKTIKTVVDMVESIINRSKEEGPISSSQENDYTETLWGQPFQYEGFIVSFYKTPGRWFAKAWKNTPKGILKYETTVYEKQKNAGREITKYIDGYNRIFRK